MHVDNILFNFFSLSGYNFTMTHTALLDTTTFPETFYSNFKNHHG